MPESAGVTAPAGTADAARGGPGLRAAIVGTGGIAGAHAEALAALGVPVVAATDVDVARLAAFADRFAIPGRYRDVEALLAAERPDLVHLCTPPGVHADAAIAALEVGATVVCEKPPCLSLAELDRILAAERAGTGHFAVVVQHRFGSAGRYVQEQVDAGALGRPTAALCTTLWQRGPAYYAVPWRGGWDVEGGGTTLGHGVHQLDLLGFVLGEWAELSARVGRLDRDIAVENVSAAHVQFENGAIAAVLNSAVSPREHSYLRFDFTRGTLELSHLYGYAAADWRYTPVAGLPAGEAIGWPPPGPDVPSSHLAQLRAVLRALRDGTRPPVTGESVRRTMELVTGIYASAFTGRPVRRAELVPGNPFYAALHGGVPNRVVPGRPEPVRSAG